MKENVSVDQALTKGHRMVNYPVVIIMLIPLVISLNLMKKGIIPSWAFFASFLIGIIFSWLYWAIMITKWKLWAFENVRNVHDLKKRALQEKLMYPEGSFSERTEIRTASDREKWKLLQSKFDREDVFSDDQTIGPETVIRYSKSKNYAEMVIMLLCLGGGVYLFIETDNYLISILFCFLGTYYAYKEFKQATNDEPQIIINEKGISTIQSGFHQWSEISNEEVIISGSGKHTHYYLSYDYPDGSVHLSIDDFDTHYKHLNTLLNIYRKRSFKIKN